ncbi:chemotaxis protein CheW [Ekhidna sp. To15]|uniref:chemotaxis protein CheW n=1 Tax=Ekhidna sp. To15 TaxID=3395267 RepID=UPI003F528666
MALGKNLQKKTAKENPLQKEEVSADVKVSGGKESGAEKEDGPNDSYQQFCIFKSKGEEYAIPINLVKEVVPFPKTAPVSQMPSYLIGMANVRGNIFGVLDLGLFFNIQSENSLEKKYLLVLEHDVYQMAIAIPDVPDTLMVAEKMIEELSASRMKSAIGQKYLKGIIKKDRRMIILFDILGMISSDKFTETS